MELAQDNYNKPYEDKRTQTTQHNKQQNIRFVTDSSSKYLHSIAERIR
jgi:hypothetical protein